MTRLPPGGAFAAELAALAWQEQRDGVKRDTEPPAWLTWFGRERVWDILADLYDLTVAANTDPKAKRRPDPYPRTPERKRSGVSFEDALRMF